MGTGEFSLVSVLDSKRENPISIRECVNSPSLSNLIVGVKITSL